MSPLFAMINRERRGGYQHSTSRTGYVYKILDWHLREGLVAWICSSKVAANAALYIDLDKLKFRLASVCLQRLNLCL